VRALRLLTPERVFILAWMLFGAGMLAGAKLERMQQAEARAAENETRLLAARSATQRLQAAQQRGDQLTLQLAERSRQVYGFMKEKRDALTNATSGRACLGAAALRVLDGAPGLRVAGLPDAAGSAAAGDGRVATDTDIGQWAIGAGAQYELCRERLGALIQWHRERK
jgi:prophage endopeptidase